MFDWQCGFVEPRDDDSASLGDDGAWRFGPDALIGCGLPVIALENARGAEDLFKFRPPDEGFALVVGNERRGISREVMRRADYVVQIPIASAQINTINVASAAAVALYRLSRGGQLVTRGGRHSGRPEVLLAGACDAIELGSAVRSAACFGWTRLFVEDRHGVWFSTDRVTRSLGRGAARRGRNPIHVVPAPATGTFDEVCVVSSQAGEPLRRGDLALGSSQLVVIADDRDSIDEGALARLGRRVRRVRLEIDHGAHRPFRLMASIALAEVARQVGGLKCVDRTAPW